MKKHKKAINKILNKGYSLEKYKVEMNQSKVIEVEDFFSHKIKGPLFYPFKKQRYTSGLIKLMDKLDEIIKQNHLEKKTTCIAPLVVYKCILLKE